MTCPSHPQPGPGQNKPNLLYTSYIRNTQKLTTNGNHTSKSLAPSGWMMRLQFCLLSHVQVLRPKVPIRMMQCTCAQVTPMAQTLAFRLVPQVRRMGLQPISFANLDAPVSHKQIILHPQAPSFMIFHEPTACGKMRPEASSSTGRLWIADKAHTWRPTPQVQRSCGRCHCHLHLFSISWIDPNDISCWRQDPAVS